MTDSLTDGEIALRLFTEVPDDPDRGWVHALGYEILLADSGAVVGMIDLRLGYTLGLIRHGGNIGYRVDPDWRGHHYAGKACKILKAVAIEHGMDVVWITCDPVNWPSRKTCEWIGATLVEIVDLPPDHDLRRDGRTQSCRYRWILY